MGIKNPSLQELISNHTKASQIALENGNKALYDLHIDYIAALKNYNTSEQDNILKSLITNFGPTEAIIYSFLTEGIAFDSNSSYGNSRTHYIGVNKIYIQQGKALSVLKITSQKVRFSNSISSFPDYSEILYSKNKKKFMSFLKQIGWHQSQIFLKLAMGFIKRFHLII